MLCFDKYFLHLRGILSLSLPNNLETFNMLFSNKRRLREPKGLLNSFQTMGVGYHFTNEGSPR